MTSIFTRRKTIVTIAALGVAFAGLMAAAPANAAAHSIQGSTQVCEGELVGATWDLGVPAANVSSGPTVTVYAYDEAYVTTDITDSITVTTATDSDGTILLSFHGLPNDAASYGALVIYPGGLFLSVADPRTVDCAAPATPLAPAAPAPAAPVAPAAPAAAAPVAPAAPATPAAPAAPATPVTPTAPVAPSAPTALASTDTSVPAAAAPAAPVQTLAATGGDEAVAPAIAGILSLFAGAALLIRQRRALRRQ